ncbi:Signal transduction histidine kinase [Nonomuraea pusilla]|uniref:histidine kinase n=2 Tax=Nonomuraea pusilla TaxID=46177 RepID=A0A1H7Z077_9ACTN|nr:Signal transduction histidine kinase [Nonomuraea pusilla]
MERVERVLDDRAAPVRPVVLSVLALGDLWLLHRPQTPADWALALGALAVCLGGGRFPLAATVTLSGLLVAGDALGAAVGLPVKAMLAVTLFELALRSGARRVAAGGVLAGGFLVWHAMSAPAAEVLPTLYRLAVLAGVPLLSGAYVRLLRRHAAQARERADAEERRRHSETLAARAAERTAIARELHDLVAHHVSSMVLRVGVARHVLPGDDPRVTQVLDDLHATGGAALVDLRRLVAVLRDPAQVDGGPFFSLVDRAELPGALEGAVARVRQAGLTAQAEVDPSVAELDAVRGLTVLRLAQEGLANAAKHAGPRAGVRLSVRMEALGTGTVGTEASGTEASGTGTVGTGTVGTGTVGTGTVGAEAVGAAVGRVTGSEGRRVRLEIVDDGGADRRRPAPGTLGHGLIGMAERVELLGGRFEAGPAPGGQGWRLYAELPPPEQAQWAAGGDRRGAPARAMEASTR